MFEKNVKNIPDVDDNTDIMHATWMGILNRGQEWYKKIFISKIIFRDDCEH